MARLSFQEFSAGKPVIRPQLAADNLAPTLSNRLADVGQEAAGQIKQAIKGEGQFAGQSPLSRGTQAVAAGFGVVPKAALEMAPEPVRSAVESAGNIATKGFDFLTDKIASTKLFSDIGKLEAQGFINPQDNPEFYNLKNALSTASAAGEISGTIAGTQGTVATLSKVAPIIKNVAETGFDATSKLVNNATNIVKQDGFIKESITPTKDLPGTVGEVLQGKPSDIAKGIKAFKEIDTQGVKTYAELGTKIDDSIKNLSKVVDDELSKDTTRVPLNDLKTELKTKSGNTVQTNYVDSALTQMKELYEKTGDVQKAADIDELIATAKTNGLTKKEINDIARVYNVEFGTKAFSKLGEPLTSVNAQLYETIRKGLKKKARDGMGGDAAKQADEAISSLYNTKTLVDKNIEAVNKLQQKITERGVLEKAGYLISKYADVLTGGSIRGFVGGILPRGAGYKTLNALDLEEKLQKNLEVIDRASKAANDSDMEKILSELET